MSTVSQRYTVCTRYWNYLRMDRNEKATLDPIAMMAALVVSSLLMLSTLRLPSVEA